MFTFRNTVTPLRDHLDRAHRLLPEAHVQAAHQATEHLHGVAQEAAQSAGHPTAVIELAEHPEAPFVGISQGPAGDRVADIEYGHFTYDKKRRRRVYVAPSPTLRNALRGAVPQAREIYHEQLRQEMGI